jgi:hypothetical protein
MMTGLMFLSSEASQLMLETENHPEAVVLNQVSSSY